MPIAPGHLLAAIADREKLPALDRRLAEALGICILGGGGGALTLLALPERLRVAERAARIGHGGRAANGAARVALVSSVYGGFFGAGLGVILTAVLAILDPGDIRRVKVLNNLFATAVSLAAVTIFILQRAASWAPTCSMFVGAMIGGCAGGHLVRILPAAVVRRFVIGSGAILTPASTYEALGPSTKNASRVGSMLEADGGQSSALIHNPAPSPTN